MFYQLTQSAGCDPEYGDCDTPATPSPPQTSDCCGTGDGVGYYSYNNNQDSAFVVSCGIMSPGEFVEFVVQVTTIDICLGGDLDDQQPAARLDTIGECIDMCAVIKDCVLVSWSETTGYCSLKRYLYPLAPKKKMCIARLEARYSATAKRSSSTPAPSTSTPSPRE